MFGKKIYPALRGNLMNQVVFKNMGGKMTEFMIIMIKWVPTPNNLEEGGYPCKNKSKNSLISMIILPKGCKSARGESIIFCERKRSSSFKQVANLCCISPTTLRKYARVLLKNELDLEGI